MLIYITTKFDIKQISFRIHPIEWNVSLAGENDPEFSKNIPGYSVEDGKDTWTVELSIENGRIHNWPHGVDAEVSLYDPEGIYLLEDNEGNSIGYVGAPPKCFKLIDKRDLSFRISENGYIEDWKMSIDLLEEWGNKATLKTEIDG